MMGALVGLHPSRRLPLLVLLALAVALAALPAAESTEASAGRTVAADWEYVPDGLDPGDSFRLLFVTSSTRDASSSNITDYNAFVRAAAGGNAGLKPFKDGFTALISTGSVNIKDNSATTGTGVPIHWLGGDKVAADYADLYDLRWNSVSGVTETGGAYTGLVWTGGNGYGATSLRSYAGAPQVRMGDLSDPTRPLGSPTTRAASEAYPFYALSPVLTVAEPELEPIPTPEPESGPPTIAAGPVIISSPISGDAYGKDEAIVMAVTFSEAVTVEGQPRVRLAVGERKRWARYDHARQDGTVLVFAYKVRGNDRDDDGVSIGADQLGLNRGSIEDADGNAASLSHPALAAQASHKVDGSQEASPADSEPAADRPGVVSFDYETHPPEVGGQLRAVLLDPDVVAGNVAWTWERSADGATWQTIDGATGDTYTATADDEGRYLRATASYTDGHGSGKTAQGALSEPVAAVITPHEPEPQPQTGTTYLSATLIVDEGLIVAGCDSTDTLMGDCSDTDFLTDNDFTVPGQTFVVDILLNRWLSNELALSFDGVTSSSAKARLSPLTLTVGGTALAFSDATLKDALGDGSDQLVWPYTATWSDQQEVSVSVTGPLLPPAKPARLKATPGNRRVTLEWTDPSESSITGYQYQQRTGRGAWGAWTNIPNSAVGEANATSYTVTGLGNGTAYGFRIRAVNAGGNGAVSDEATAKPSATIIRPVYLDATLTVDKDDEFYGCDNEATDMDNCSSVSVLSDDDFTYRGTTYTIKYLWWDSDSSSLELNLAITGLTGAQAKAALSPLTLTVAGSAFAVIDADTAGDSVKWSFNPSWSDNQVVSLSLTGPPAGTEVTEVVCEASTTTGTQCYVPWNSPLIPRDGDGEPAHPPGESFRLMFMTSGQSQGTASTVGPYNGFVQNTANGVATLKPLKDHFRAMLSGTDRNARDNTHTEAGDLGENSPIYWTNHNKVGDNYADLYDGSWDHNSDPNQWPSLETGAAIVSRQWYVWTGSNSDGSGSVGFRMGDTTVSIGEPNVSGQELNVAVSPKGSSRRFYGISPLLTVGSPPPVSPYAPIWFATLTVDEVDRFHGCDNRLSNRDNCSDRRVLEYTSAFRFDPGDLDGAEHGFFGWVDHSIQFLEWDSGVNLLRLSLDGKTGAEIKAALRGLTLNVVDSGDSYALAVNDAAAEDTFIQWPLDPRFDWSDGQKVFLSLTLDGRQPAPPKLTGLRAVPRNAEVYLTWDAPDEIETWPGKQQVRYRARGDDAWGDWTGWRDMVSDSGSVDIGSYTVTGLDNDTRYQFEVRPVNAGGKGPASARVNATPKETPAAPTGLVANSADASVILHWDPGNNDSITRYQYRWRITGSTWNSWTNVPVTQDGIEFHPSDITSVTVTDGMANDNLQREFQVRARNANGAGTQSATSNAVKPEALPAAPQAQSVPHDWTFIPDGVKPGQSFRLLFVTSTRTSATSTRISEYNAFVQNRASFIPVISSFKDEFRAVISTAAVSARANIDAGPDGDGVPVYWVQGGLVVGPGGDLFEDDWADTTPRQEGGEVETDAQQVWTGTWHDGRSAFAPYYHPYVRFYAGAEHVYVGNPHEPRDGIAHVTWGYPNYENGANPPGNETQLRLYGISPVITVQQPP